MREVFLSLAVFVFCVVPHVLVRKSFTLLPELAYLTYGRGVSLGLGFVGEMQGSSLVLRCLP